MGSDRKHQVGCAYVKGIRKTVIAGVMAATWRTVRRLSRSRPARHTHPPRPPALCLVKIAVLSSGRPAWPSALVCVARWIPRPAFLSSSFALCHSFHLSSSLKIASRHFSLTATGGARRTLSLSRQDNSFFAAVFITLVVSDEKLRVSFGGLTL
ncbi:hypothetical protein M3J09_003917 [Ascochyta lentis]